MKKLNLFSNLWSSLVGSRSCDVRVTSDGASDEHPMSIRLVSDETPWRHAGNLWRICAVLALLLTVGVGNAWGANIVIDLDLTKSATYPDGFPTSSGSHTSGTHTFGGYSFSFSCATDYYRGINGSNYYILIGKAGATENNASIITFPAIANYKLTEVKITTPSTTGTNVAASIRSNYSTTLSGGTSWTFAVSSSKTWTLSGTAANTAYKMYIVRASGTKTYNGQLSGLKLTYEPTGSTYTLGYSVSPSGKASVALGSTSLAKDATTTATYSSVATGYEFLYWSISGTGATLSHADVSGHSTDNPVTVTMGTANATVTANLQCITPTISVHPSNGTCVQGGSPSALTVTASGGSLSYQWKQCATADGTYTNASGGSGATTASYTPPVSSTGTTYYKCVVTNTGSSCSTTATSNYASFEVTAPTPATITLRNYSGDATTTGYYSGGSFTLPDENDFTCGELTFVGWSTVAINSPSATKPNSNYYEKGASVTLGATNTFYAVFAESSVSGGGYVLVTDDGDLSTNDRILIASAASSSASVLGYQKVDSKSVQTNRFAISDVSIDANSIMNPDIASDNTETTYAFEIELQGTSSGWYLYDVANEGYLQANGGTSSNLLTYNTESIRTDDDTWTIEINETNYKATVQTLTGTESSNRGCMRFNSTLFSCYNSCASQSDIYIFKKTDSYSNYTTNCVTMVPVYLDAANFEDNSGAQFAVYSWKNGSSPTDDKLAEAFMDKVSSCQYDHLYVGEMPEHHDRVIFLRNSDAASTPTKNTGDATFWNKTVDITTETNKDLFTISSGGEGNTYTGTWSAYSPYYTVTFNNNTGGAFTATTAPSSQCIVEGGKASAPTNPKALGKQVTGWYEESGCTNEWIFGTNTVSEAVTLYANWESVSTKTIYLDASAVLSGDNRWDAASAVLFARASIGGTSLSTDVKMTGRFSSCQEHVYAFTIPGNATKVKFFRCANGATSVIESGSVNVWNQTGEVNVEANKDLYTISDWGSVGLESTAFAATTYTISFAGNSGSGSMTSEVVNCDDDYTVKANEFTYTGRNFTGWKANVDVTISSETVTAGTLITGGSTLEDIQSNVTLTAQWEIVVTTVTLNKNGATSGTNQTVSATYGSAMPTTTTASAALAAPSKNGYTLLGYWDTDASSGGTQYYDANMSSVTTWDKETATATLYARWSINTDQFIDDMHNTTGYTSGSPHEESGASYTMPGGDFSDDASGNECETSHYKFVGWVDSGGQNDDGTLKDSGSRIYRPGETKHATNATYYAVWAEE